MNQLPVTYKHALAMRPSKPYEGENISCVFIPFSSALPKFLVKDAEKNEDVNKSYKVPAGFEISKILNYLYHTLNVKDAILETNPNADPADLLAMAIELPEELRSRDGGANYIMLDNYIRLGEAFNYLYYYVSEESQLKLKQ